MNSTFARLGATAAASLAVFAFATPAAQARPPTGGANPDCGAYCPPPGEPSGNGQGKTHSQRPAAKGNADSKNPPGQAPDGTDGNNGYECDGNKGVALGNPAHSPALRRGVPRHVAPDTHECELSGADAGSTHGRILFTRVRPSASSTTRPKDRTSQNRPDGREVWLPSSRRFLA